MYVPLGHYEQIIWNNKLLDINVMVTNAADTISKKVS